MKMLGTQACGEIAGIALPGNIVAYRMDWHNDDKHDDMRQMSGIDLGNCSCCDYFIILDRYVALVETTHLGGTVKRLEEECKCMKMPEYGTKKYLRGEILRENVMKVYGSLLMLCRLSAICPSIKDGLKDKEYHIWIINESKPYEAYDLALRLKSTFGRAVANDIQIMSPIEMVEILK